MTKKTWKLSRRDKEQLVLLYQCGLSGLSLGRHFKISAIAVYKILSNRNVPRRARFERERQAWQDRWL
jgi:hypothetical protein